MRILYVIDSLRYGGAERQLVELIKGITFKREYEPHLIYLVDSLDGYYNVIKRMGIPTFCFSRRFKYDLAYPLLSIADYIRKNHIDLVHTFMTMGSLFGVLAAKLTGRKVICSAIRDGKDKTFSESIIKKFLAFLSDYYVSNSVAGFTNRFKKIKRNFIVVYNGVDFSRFGNEKGDLDELKMKIGVAHFKKIVGMVASMSDHKDHETLLKAIPLILQAHPDTGFVLIGDGPKRSELESLAKTLAVDKNVVFTGYRSDVDSLYRIMDVCVLLTNAEKFYEGIPNVLIEALACEVPVVASKGGGTDELIRDGETGILIPPKNAEVAATAIIKILSDKRFADEIAKTGRKDVMDRFNLNRYVNQYEELYNLAIYRSWRK